MTLGVPDCESRSVVWPFSEMRNPGSKTSFKDQGWSRKVMAFVFNMLNLRGCGTSLETMTRRH